MKKYTLNTRNNTLHISDSKYKRCNSMNKEHRMEFQSIEEVKKIRESKVKFCRLCMRDEAKKYKYFI